MCIIEGCAVKSETNFLPYLAGPICKRAITSLNLSLSISVSVELASSYLLSEFRHDHQLHSHFTRQCNQLYMAVSGQNHKILEVFGLTGCVPFIPSPPILELLKSSISLSP